MHARSSASYTDRRDPSFALNGLEFSQSTFPSQNSLNSSSV